MKIIDVHVHGIGGHDTRAASDDEILRIAELHGARGTTDMVMTVYPDAPDIMGRNISVIKAAMMKQTELAKTRAMARIGGIHLEGPFLNPARCGALDPASFQTPDVGLLRDLISGADDIIRIVTLAPELPGVIELIKHLTSRGIVVSMGHSDATFAQAEEAFQAGARGVTHLFNAMSGIHHRAPGLAGFGLINPDVYVEVIADPYHLDPAITEFIFSAKSPERIMLVSDAVKDTPAKDAERAVRDEAGRLMGGSHTVWESAEALCRRGVSRDLVMKTVSDNPSRYLVTAL